jgi:hypothetical protein
LNDWSSLKKHLKEQQTQWLRILNSRYQTDGGTSLVDYAKGRLTAYTELLAYIKTKENPDYGRPTEDKRRPRKTA